MNPTRTSALSILLALTAACGGSGSGTATSAMRAAAPSTEAFTVDGGGVPLSPAMGTGVDAMTLFPPIFIGGDDPCHPHLFQRTEAVAARLNRHLYKFLGRIDRLIASHPALETDGQVQWTAVRPSGLEERFTITKVADLHYSWLLEIRADANAAWTTIFSGQIDRTGATGPHQGAGDMTLDLDALHSVVPLEPAQGVITAHFDVRADRRLLALDAAGVVWDRAGDPDDLPPVAPRNAHYVSLREPGVGGSLKAADQMIFLCPANPLFVRADVELVSRHYRLADGSVHGRSDARMTGGQLAAAQTILGLTCHEVGPAGTAAEGYWLMKLEDGGAVSWSASRQAGTGTPCDPIFGPVPATDSTANDFDFSAVTFTDGTAYPFPNMVP